MYKASQETGANGQPGADGGAEQAANDSSDDVTDVEFEEVKDDDKK